MTNAGAPRRQRRRRHACTSAVRLALPLAASQFNKTFHKLIASAQESPGRLTSEPALVLAQARRMEAARCQNAPTVMLGVASRTLHAARLAAARQWAARLGQPSCAAASAAGACHSGPDSWLRTAAAAGQLRPHSPVAAAAAGRQAPPASAPGGLPSHLAQLNEEQLAAVTAPLGTIRVVAGPGSGKV